MYRNYLKRFFDVIAAFFGLLILSPIILLVSLLLFFYLKSNPFFIQKRPGKNGKVFSIIKFKTMSDDKDNKGKLLPDKDRLFPLGVWIRKFSLDEIPQLLNVLKGDMSIIGPRPLLTTYLHLYNNFQKRRHEVKPGITGLAQVNGRNSISWNEKFEYDVWYVDNYSFTVDFIIFLKTIKKVIISDGINTREGTSIEPFDGE